MDTLIKERLGKALLLVLSVFAIGTAGFYILLHDLTLMDALYLTIITLTTVGYGDITPHNNMPSDGNPYFIKFFTISIILIGMGSVLYVLSLLTEYAVSANLGEKRAMKRMKIAIETLRGHYILCGGGRAGFYIMEELKATLRPFVLIEASSERIDELLTHNEDLLYIKGDSTQDEIIEQAGLDHASGIIAALPDEKDNLFIVMSLTQKKWESGSDFRIAAKVEHFRKMKPKLKTAGADYIISPERISSRRMVSEMFRPSVTSFLDRMLNDETNVIRVEEVVIEPESDFDGKTLAELKIPDKCRLLIAAVRKKGKGSFIANPRADQQIDTGDVLIVMGDMEKITRLRSIADGN
ncbi:potassium channel family protein [Thermodesulfobacteriota bacterium]